MGEESKRIHDPCCLHVAIAKRIQKGYIGERYKPGGFKFFRTVEAKTKMR